jgi:hypothetical protein
MSNPFHYFSIYFVVKSVVGCNPFHEMHYFCKDRRPAFFGMEASVPSLQCPLFISPGYFTHRRCLPSYWQSNNGDSVFNTVLWRMALYDDMLPQWKILYEMTNSLERNLSWETNSSSASQESSLHKCSLPYPQPLTTDHYPDPGTYKPHLPTSFL